MSELIQEARKRRDLLKHMILQLHDGQAPEAVRTQLVRLLGEVPYHEVVTVEQELISEGLPAEEVLKLCDVHTAALRGHIDQKGAKKPPAGHPVDTFQRENRALEWEVTNARALFQEIDRLGNGSPAAEVLARLRARFYALSDVEKHYRRKENLVFPFLEKHGITGPPKVMWGKHDQVREALKASLEALQDAGEAAAEEAQSLASLLFRPATDAVEDMIYREEKILFPMSLDTLSEAEWYQVYQQSPEIGFCLIDPLDDWRPEPGAVLEAVEAAPAARIQLPTGSLTVPELDAVLNKIPFDLTFVDKDDTVRYFTQGRERIFDRNRAVLGRKVQLCHPPHSVHIVQRILDDFRSGSEERAPFWINLKGRFIHIEYFALRDKEGGYLGTLEVSQDLTEKRALEGEQRLLAYGGDEE
ncbi:MAG: DUF438 domain-containing protein [Acidobacteria bacterium]|nr:DUF438 domain-containing protein [Acidobacteriota bacterium]